jgi:hypothetical protein
VGVGVSVGVGVLLGVWVAVAVLVAVAVSVGVAVSLGVGVTLGVFVAVLVAVAVGVLLAVAVAVAVAVLVGVGVSDGVGVGVLHPTADRLKSQALSLKATRKPKLSEVRFDGGSVSGSGMPAPSQSTKMVEGDPLIGMAIGKFLSAAVGDSESNSPSLLVASPYILVPLKSNQSTFAFQP